MIAACCGVALLIPVGAVYWPLLTAGFAHPDDTYYVFGSARIWSPTWVDVRNAFRRAHFPSQTGGYYQPITTLSYMLDAIVTGDSDAKAFHFHLTNWLLHLANTALVFALVRRLCGRLGWSILLAMLFGLHPLQGEAVAIISQRMTLLGTFFALLALHAYVSHALTNTWTSYAVVPLFYILAVLSKPTFMMLPLFFLLLDVWPFRRPLRVALLEKIPLFLMMGATAIMQFQIHREAVVRLPEAWNPLAVFLRNAVSMGTRLVWPPSLAPAYPIIESAEAPLPWPMMATIVCIAGVAALIAARRFARPLLAAGLGALLLALPAMINLPFTDRMLGHAHLYPALIAPLVALAAWLKSRPEPWQGRLPRAAAAGLLAVLVAFTIGAADQTFVYREGERLFLRTVERNPRWLMGYIGLVENYMVEGNAAEALAWVDRAAAVEPDHKLVSFYRGTALLATPSRTAEALEPLQRAHAADTEWAACLQNLGVCLARLGRVDEAIVHLEKARNLAPHVAGTRIALGNAYLQKGHGALARGEFQEGLSLGEDPRAHFGLALAWMENDVPEFARRHLRAALARDERLVARAAAAPTLSGLLEPGEGAPDARHPSSLPADYDFQWPAARTARGS